MGQRPFDPPSVAGWDWGPAWMSSNSMRAALRLGQLLACPRGARSVEEGQRAGDAHGRREAFEQALKARRAAAWISRHARAQASLDLAARCYDDIAEGVARRGRPRAEMLQRALRHLLLSGPDAQLH